MATHSSTPACKIPWAGELGRLQFMGSLLISEKSLKYWKTLMPLIWQVNFPHPPILIFTQKLKFYQQQKLSVAFLCVTGLLFLFVKEMSAKYLHLNNYTLIGIFSGTKLHSMGGEKREQLVYLTTQIFVEDCLLHKITILLWYTAEMLSL